MPGLPAHLTITVVELRFGDGTCARVTVGTACTLPESELLVLFNLRFELVLAVDFRLDERFELGDLGGRRASVSQVSLSRIAAVAEEAHLLVQSLDVAFRPLLSFG